MTRYRWVLDRKAEGFPITMACKVAEVSRQAFHDWRQRRAAGPTDVELADAALVAAMREIQADFDDTYGQPRMTPELRERGFEVNHKRVERLMRQHGIVGVHKPAKVRTTIPAGSATVATIRSVISSWTNNIPSLVISRSNVSVQICVPFCASTSCAVILVVEPALRSAPCNTYRAPSSLPIWRISADSVARFAVAFRDSTSRYEKSDKPLAMSSVNPPAKSLSSWLSD